MKHEKPIFLAIEKMRRKVETGCFVYLVNSEKNSRKQKRIGECLEFLWSSSIVKFRKISKKSEFSGIKSHWKGF